MSSPRLRRPVSLRIGAAALAAIATSVAAATPAQGGVAAIDDTGREIRLPHAAQRIVSLSPGITELLFSAGAGARIVGTAEDSDYPPAARRIPRIARNAGIDIERVAALRPDLIVAWGSGYSPARLDALRSLGIPVYIVEPRTLSGIAVDVERMGMLAGSPATAIAAAARYRLRLQRLRNRYAGRKPLRVFVQIWSDPLMTLSGKHVVSEMLRVCGARNVFAQLPGIAPAVDAEAVLAADPDAIVAAEPGDRSDADDGALDFWKRFPRLRATAHNGFVFLDADELDRGSLRVLDAAQALCTRLARIREDSIVSRDR
ncbi:ABC-type Fe3+-hydroxamate transport system, periplasmic component [Burkholderiales bacterium GJ-E10]|nr:ABC-type Fe3+-hydroxamate transport system, periplasmic component [Burkholderiales bacterium GJ-E10]